MLPVTRDPFGGGALRSRVISSQSGEKNSRMHKYIIMGAQGGCATHKWVAGSFLFLEV